LKVGIVGFPRAGKTTVFNALTGLQAQVGGYGDASKPNLGTIKVPDARIDRLRDIFSPRKTTYAEMVFVDFPGGERRQRQRQPDEPLSRPLPHQLFAHLHPPSSAAGQRHGLHGIPRPVKALAAAAQSRTSAAEGNTGAADFALSPWRPARPPGGRAG
jgi:hypothetical protein